MPGEDIIQQARAMAQPLVDIVAGWLLAPAAWSQFMLLAATYLAAARITRRISPILPGWLDPGDKANMLAAARRFALPFLAARIFVHQVLTDSFLKLLGKYVLVPVAALYALGVLDVISLQLGETIIALGSIRFSVMALIHGVIAGSLLFWLGSWSNRHRSDDIKKQKELRPAPRELAIKAIEVAILGAAFLLLIRNMGIDLTAIAVLGGALGVGIGLGLQQIAANFVSGTILLIEGQTTVGDFVELDGGEKGTIVKMTARACVLETFDGKWIVVPNDHFITTRVINCSDQGSANSYEVADCVAYETDISTIPDLISQAVAAFPFFAGRPLAAQHGSVQFRPKQCRLDRQILGQLHG